jgi:hypothetical protein
MPFATDKPFLDPATQRPAYVDATRPAPSCDGQRAVQPRQLRAAHEVSLVLGDQVTQCQAVKAVAEAPEPTPELPANTAMFSSLTHGQH